jgi:hypothetical protein
VVAAITARPREAWSTILRGENIIFGKLEWWSELWRPRQIKNERLIKP